MITDSIAQGYRMTVISTAAPNGPSADSDAMPSTISYNNGNIARFHALFQHLNASSSTDL